MAQDRPEEFDRLYPPKRAEARDDFERRGFANVVVLLTAAALILIGYLVFNSLEQVAFGPNRDRHCEP